MLEPKYLNAIGLSLLTMLEITYPSTDLTNSVQDLPADDAFKQMVKKECGDFGLEAKYPTFVAVETEPTKYPIYTRPSKGIFVSQAIYDCYASGNADNDLVRYIIRHEASHIKHNDSNSSINVRICMKIVLVACCLYGSDYIINRAQEKYDGHIPEFFDQCTRYITKNCVSYLAIKHLLNPINDFFFNYFFRYHNELRADREACSDITLTSAAIRCFENIIKETVEHDKDTAKLWEKPLTYRLKTGYPSPYERLEKIRAIKQRLDSNTQINNTSVIMANSAIV